MFIMNEKTHLKTFKFDIKSDKIIHFIDDLEIRKISKQKSGFK